MRLVHLGLGSFFRAHQAWYTDLAPDAEDWGIAAFTGRSPALAEALRAQGGRYTLVTQGPAGPTFRRIAALSDVRAASEHEAWLAHLADPAVCVVTITVTEAGYGPGPGAAPARLVAGLAARRAAGAGAISLVPCDNLPANGPMLRSVVRELAEPGLRAWIDDHVDFVTTMVDRITPATTDADRALVLAETGVEDRAPVVTEAYSEWVLSGAFPAGRPDWDATFVDDVAPYERRKLWLLNGAHSLLAYAGLARGHETVQQAVTDPTLRGWVEEWWDEAARRLPQSPAETAAYRVALLARFANPGIRHLLAQVALDGDQKIPARILPSLRAERAAGRLPTGSARVVAAWVRWVVAPGPVDEAAVERVLGPVAPDLAADHELVRALASMPGM
ncbi:mannitol dehydrogenase family protein [Nocardioides sp. URHA0020]|uniref:mannitol dehydrogenase family protein n=1 Tax=Nocardioides sp. URHA0020 TaxID=1380392 RepID=UPI0005683A01|nr:mannitol dehydrogenase family protein [Nocardioides sp. URHA0020]